MRRLHQLLDHVAVVPAPVLHPDHEGTGNRELLYAAVDRMLLSRDPKADGPVPLPLPVLQSQGAHLLSGIPLDLPSTGLGDSGALDALAASTFGGSAQLHHPGYFAHMDPPTPAVAMAAALWQASTNQNMLHPDAAPSARGLERRVVQWLAPFFGMDGGHLVPGSTVANLTALWAARDIRGAKRVIASDKCHLSMPKAAKILGMEFVSAPTDASHRMQDLAQFGDLSETVVVLTAGTVATGAIDPLPLPVVLLPNGATSSSGTGSIGGASSSQPAWIHVDAAWAAPLRFTDQQSHLLDDVQHADSVGFSCHKWLYQPKGVGAIMFKDSAAAHAALSFGGGYLSAPNVGVVGSAPASALPLAATLLAWGQQGLAKRIEDDLEKAKALCRLIEQDERFELWAGGGSTAGATGVVVWRPRNVPAAEVRDRLRGAWVSLTEIDGERWLRCVSANPSADPERVFAAVVAAL